MNSAYDVIIAGAGIVGGTLATALAQQGLRLALIDTQFSTKLTTPASNYDSSPTDDHAHLRVSAIYAGELTALRRLGIWPPLEESDYRAGEFQRMHIWESQNRAAITFDAAEIGLPRLGAVIENQRLVSALYQKLESAEVSLINSRVAETHWPDKQSVEVILENGERLSGSLLVAADGTHSTIRRQAGIDISRRDYHQQAVVATVKPQQHHQYTAWQKFLPTGPVAFLPLAEGDCSIVWSTDPDSAAALVNQSDTHFCQKLAEAINGKLGPITESSRRISFPLFQQQARSYIGNRIALIGDAAHRIHPLAGMGANLGITDALVLAQLLENPSHDYGNSELLNRYDRQRRSQVNAYLSGQEALRNCYRWSSPLASGLRRLGVTLLDKSKMVKPELLEHTLGLSGNLPRLMRP